MNTPNDLLSPVDLRSPGETGRDESADRGRLPVPDSLNVGTFVRRHGRLMVASGLLAAAAAFFGTKQIAPSYVATASIRIDQKSWQLPALDALGFTPGNALATELEILRGRPLAEEVVDSLGLQLALQRPRSVPRSHILSQVVVDRSAAPTQYRLLSEGPAQLALLDRATERRVRGLTPGDSVNVPGVRFHLNDSASSFALVDLEVRTFQSAVSEVRNGLSISRRNRDAEIIDVSYRGNDAELASEIVNTLARRFVEGRQDLRQAEARSAVRFLSEQIARVSEQLDEAERALKGFREQENIVSLPDEASSGVTRHAELQAQRHAVEAERAALAALLDGGHGRPSAARDSSFHSLLAFPTLLRSGVTAGLLTALVTAEEQRNDLRARRTVADPDVQVLDARIAQIHAESRALVGTYLQGLTNQVAALDVALAGDGARLRSIPRKELELAELERAVTSSASTYSMLQTRLKEAEIAAAASDMTVRVVEPSVVPLNPVWPRPLLNLAAAFLLGLMLGGAAGFVRELTDRSLHTRRDLLARTGVPVLGMVPRAAPQGRFQFGRSAQPDLIADHVRALFPNDAGRTGAANTRIVSRSAGRGKGTERVYSFTPTDAFAWLATNIAFVRRDPPIRALVVTSPLSSDGKTTIATNLALTFARNGKRVLLIDADMRAGRIAAALGLPREPGLSNWLADALEHDMPINRLSLPAGAEMDVIVSGSMSSAAAQLLGSDRLGRLMDWAKSAYDYTIIDTAPVNLAADAALVAPQSDGVVIVARAGATERQAIEFAMDQLAMVHAPIAGAVLNDVDLRRDGAYDRAYGYYG